MNENDRQTFNRITEGNNFSIKTGDLMRLFARNGAKVQNIKHETTNRNEVEKEVSIKIPGTKTSLKIAHLQETPYTIRSPYNSISQFTAQFLQHKEAKENIKPPTHP